MTVPSKRLAIAAVLFLIWTGAASAQTAEEVIEKAITAMGGRAAHAKLKNRSTTGTITLTTPAGDISGPIEVQNVAPNKSRSVIKADLTALGAGQLVIDQRFDGTSGYVMDTLQGNREMTGNQLDNMRNQSFPNALMDYKDRGIAAKLTGKETVGGRDAFVVVFEPTAGSAVREFFDAETYLPIQTVIKVTVPQLGTDLEQTTELSDYREVDGVKVPFQIKASSSIQNYTITVTKVEHNVALDEALFSKPK